MEQTVHRAPPRAPERGAKDCKDSPALETSAYPPYELILPLLPVRSARELAVGLAQQWQIWSGVHEAIVAFSFVASGRKFIACSRRDDLPQIVESHFDGEQAESGFPQFAFAEDRTLLPGQAPVASFSFPCSAGTAGGVLLYSAQPVDLSSAHCQNFGAWSGRLVEQAALVDGRSRGRHALETAKAQALAEFAAGAGHEINNPLATIAGRVQMLLRQEADGNRRQELATIGAQALRVRDMIGDLMLFARPPVPAPQRLLLNDIAQSVMDQFADTARAQSCRLELAAAGPVFATADPTQLRIVMSELIRNSLEALDRSADQTDDHIDGEILVRLEAGMRDARPGAAVSVADNGPGLSEKDRKHLFDPFYSGRDAGRGLGFGLCKCWRIMSIHDGAIEVDSVPKVATTFRLFWPDEASRPSDGTPSSGS